MEKKYQIFVSSTYKDLSEERQEVMQALLELDCIPVGMELFPAADDDQWTLIQRLIDDCDYYIIIVGGRYGSLNKDGVSFTQMEYEYALSKEIPIIGFLHKNPENIAVGKSEKDGELKQKLEKFKDLVRQKMCRYWENPSNLGSLVSRSLVKLIKDKPRYGWVKATFLPSEDIAKEILALKKQNELLQIEIAKSKDKAPEGTENLSSGEDSIEVNFSVVAVGDWGLDKERYTEKVDLIWNEIFAEISPLMIDETTESVIKSKINEIIRKKRYKDLAKKFKKDNRTPAEFSITDTDFQTLKIQFRALGYITESLKKRSIHDKGKYWALTPYGDTIMTRLRAIKK
ncbi:MAG: DUF4062 domain-containing protein [Desulfuromonadales bacterium]|nr:DUF4062 domain-containing protein [Desulfuromonadales bacterium]